MIPSSMMARASLFQEAENGPHPGFAAARSSACIPGRTPQECGAAPSRSRQTAGALTSYVTHIETGQKHVALLELIEWAEAIGFDPEEAIERISKLTSK